MKKLYYWRRYYSTLDKYVHYDYCIRNNVKEELFTIPVTLIVNTDDQYIDIRWSVFKGIHSHLPTSILQSYFKLNQLYKAKRYCELIWKKYLIVKKII